MNNRGRAAFGILFQWIAIAGALAYAFSLYVANLMAWPANISVQQWWGSELAIRYCQGFVRRGIFGQIAWQIGGWLGRQQHYVLALSLVMALAVLAVGIWLGWLLVRRCGWRLGLLILAAPVGWPVLLESAGSTFRKDPLQILLGLLLLWIWHQRVRGRSLRAAPAAWFLLAVVQVFAVLNHEPFALLILPVLAIAALGVRRDWSRALMATSPGLLAFLLAVWNKGTTSQVACLRDDLQRLGLLGPTEMPGSSITELALSRPSFFTWDLSASNSAGRSCMAWQCPSLLCWLMPLWWAWALPQLQLRDRPRWCVRSGFGLFSSLWPRRCCSPPSITAAGLPCSSVPDSVCSLSDALSRPARSTLAPSSAQAACLPLPLLAWSWSCYLLAVARTRPHTSWR